MIYKDIHEAYLSVLRDVYFNYEYLSSPRGLAIREKMDYKFTIENPKAEAIKTLDDDRNIVIERYLKQEMELYNSGTNKAEDFVKASKFWDKIKNPNGTINSAYGHLLFFYPSQGNEEFGETFKTPWQWALDSLKKDKYTRQAIMRFNLPEHCWDGVKDFVCTMHGNFLIRNNKLYLTITMRSNDVNTGLLYDLSFFVSLMDKMLEELKPTYPTLEKGNYTHIAHSFHAYEKDEVIIKKMLGI